MRAFATCTRKGKWATATSGKLAWRSSANLAITVPCTQWAPMADQYWADRDTFYTAAPLPKSSLRKKRSRRRSLVIARKTIMLANCNKNKKKPSRMKKYCHISPMMMMFCSKWIWTQTRELAQTLNKTNSRWKVRMQLNLSKCESMSANKICFSLLSSVFTPFTVDNNLSIKSRPTLMIWPKLTWKTITIQKVWGDCRLFKIQMSLKQPTSVDPLILLKQARKTRRKKDIKSTKCLGLCSTWCTRSILS